MQTAHVHVFFVISLVLSLCVPGTVRNGACGFDKVGQSAERPGQRGGMAWVVGHGCALISGETHSPGWPASRKQTETSSVRGQRSGMTEASRVEWISIMRNTLCYTAMHVKGNTEKP